MEYGLRTKSVEELSGYVDKLLLATCGLTVAFLILGAAYFFQSKIVIVETPGMPNNAQIEKSKMDKRSQQATVLTVFVQLASVNPANAEYRKFFLQSFLAAEVYTKVSFEIDAQAKRLVDQRELGSYYFVLTKEPMYDEPLNRWFVRGDVHTVNAGKDTALPYIFEVDLRIDNYRPVVTALTSYQGEIARTSAWMASQKK